ncbi:MAG TPA: leucine-rich repeat protein [Prolixibacteraceae bacterium]|nr:leucine-rich repeat protein [Prolixibacteraceae bacterium]
MKSTIKKISLILTGLLFSMVLCAQLAVTVDNTSGNLKNNLADKDPGSIVSLTITGTMDARDFKFMRDEMPALADIDMSGATVTYYLGPDGTMDDYWKMEYPANKVPSYAFCDPKTYVGKTTLVSVKIPKVRAVLHNSFWGCINLKSVVFPSTVTTIGERAFYSCTSLVNMELPPFIKILERTAFSTCTSLTSVTLPSTLTSMGTGVFANCTGLRSIRIISFTPQDFINSPGEYGYYGDLFSFIDKEHCILYVPYGTKALYEAAEGWKDFKNIVEASTGFMVSADSLQFSTYGGDDNNIIVSSNTEWKVSSDQPWLTVSPMEGNSEARLIITAAASQLVIPRQAIVTVAAEGSPVRKITVIQQANPGSMTLTPGSLSSVLDEGERSLITSLTLTGQIDARDFKTIRDELPHLGELDMNGATIAAYSGLKGTIDGMHDYPANEVPPFAFYDKLSANGNFHLTQVNLPLSAIAVGEYAFTNCYKITSIYMPDGVSFIGRGTFQNCYSLQQLDIPESLTSIEPNLFNNSSIKEASFPAGLTAIKDSAFYSCHFIETVTIPASVTTIGSYAFAYCEPLYTLSVEPVTPPDLRGSAHVFLGVDTSRCVVFVPVGSYEQYKSAEQWKDFKNFYARLLPFYINFTNLFVDEKGSDNSQIIIVSEVEWTAVADAPWLTFTPSSGTGNSPILIHTEPNPTADTRIATITFSSPGYPSFVLTVHQGTGIPTLHITPGSLSSALSENEKSLTDSLVLTGTMDARDFRTIRLDMPNLVYLDIEKVDIVAYTDQTHTYSLEYPANTIPANYWDMWDGSRTDYSLTASSLKTIKLPLSLTEIGRGAFRSCVGLTSLEIPSSVETIGVDAFIYCIRLKSINLPPSLTYLGRYAFYSCDRLVDIDMKATITSINDATFGDCRSLTTLDIPESVTAIEENAFLRCDSLQTIVIPPFVSKIGPNAFSTCFNLNSVVIPSSVKDIGSGAFYDCTKLQAIYSLSPTPPDLSGSPDVFYNVNHTEAVLYVPAGSKELYAVANQWKDFIHIVEKEDFTIDSNEFNLMALPTATEDMKQSAAGFKCFPNPFSHAMTIEIANPSHKEVSIEIYRINGQKVRSLLNAQKVAKISLGWNGEDENGKEVMPGVYLLRVNGETRKVMKE